MRTASFDWSQNYRAVDVSRIELLQRVTKRLSQRHRFFTTVYGLLQEPTPSYRPRVLEVACGMGIEASILSLLGYATVALDFNVDALSYAHRVRCCLSSGLSLLRGNAFHLCFPDSTFDLVYSQGFLEHWYDRDVVRLLEEQTRVLRHGGFLIVDVPNRYSAYSAYKLYSRLTGGWVFGFERQFSPQQVRSFVRKACPSMIYENHYGWSFRGYPVRRMFDFVPMAPLLAVRAFMRLLKRGEDNVVVVFRKSSQN